MAQDGFTGQLLRHLVSCEGAVPDTMVAVSQRIDVKHGPTGRREAVACLTFNALRKEWQRSANGGKSPLALFLTLKNHAIEILDIVQ